MISKASLWMTGSLAFGRRLRQNKGGEGLVNQSNQETERGKKRVQE